MRNKILFILIMVVVSSLSYSQLYISTDQRKDFEWNNRTNAWDEISNKYETTIFEFEDTAQEKMGVFVHRTDDITSAYLIKSHNYNDDYDWDEFEIVSDVGNKYSMYIKIGDNESEGYIWFSHKKDNDDWRAIKHSIKSIWTDEKESDLNSEKSGKLGCVSGDCENGYGTYIYSNGEKYTGNFKEGDRHGYGTYDWSIGDAYQGYWKFGLQDGYGKYTFADGIVREGQFKEGEFIGENNDKFDNSINKSWSGGGTGFFIDRKGYFATNYHVVDGSSEIQIEFYREGELQTHNAQVIKEDKINDLVILKISDEDFKYFDEIPYNFSSRVLDIGEEVFALGYPLTNFMGKDIKFTDGKISSKTGYDGDIANYQTTTPIQPGNSGGPLFDYNGNLIGINASRLTFENTQNVSYSIKSSYLKNLIDVLPVRIKLPNNKDIQDLKLTEKIKIISDYVVLIKVK